MTDVWVRIITASIAAIPPTLYAYAALKQGQKNAEQNQVHADAVTQTLHTINENVNGKMEALIKTTEAAANLQGHKDERANPEGANNEPITRKIT